MFTRFFDTEFLQAMADAGPAMNWISDGRGSCSYFNRTWLDFTGRALQEEAGIGWVEGVHHDDRKRLESVYKSFIAARKAYRIEFRLRRHDGVYRRVLHHGLPLFAPDGECTGYFGNCVDISERESLRLQTVGPTDDYLERYRANPPDYRGGVSSPSLEDGRSIRFGSAPDPSPASDLRERTIRVFIADDHTMIRNGLRALMETCSEVEVVGEARNGAEAVEMALLLQPDVILMDVNMPEMNGIEATRRIKRQQPTTQVIGLSMSRDEHTAEAMRLAGATRLLAKDVNPEQLLALIRRTQQPR